MSGSGEAGEGEKGKEGVVAAMRPNNPQTTIKQAGTRRREGEGRGWAGDCFQGSPT